MKKGLILAFCACAGAGLAHAAVLNVPSVQYPEIQDGVDAAQPGDTVLVAPGTYSDVTHIPPDSTLSAVIMKSDITLLGSGPGVTIIDCDSLGRGIHCEGVTNARIEGFTIKAAFAESYGSAIFCLDGSSPIITNCELTGNGDGGIICVSHSSPPISYCDITNNGSKQGGGIAIEDTSSSLITHCTITGNYAPKGGGVYVRNHSAPFIQHCVISENYLDALNNFGGGIAVDNARVSISNSEINDNIGTGSGGGLAISDDSYVYMLDCLIQGNITTGDYGPGGGIFCGLAEMVLERCTITKNDVSGSFSDGGGIYVAISDMTIINCTIAGNISDPTWGPGSGITCSDSSPDILQTIIASNTPGRGIYCELGTENPSVTCCDIYGNPGGDDICGNGTVANNFSADPMFCDMNADDYTLDIDSPCLPGNHPQGEPCALVGAHGVGCGDILVVPDAAGLIKGHYAAPNPFRPATWIHFELAGSGHVRLGVYDVGGRLVRLLEDGQLDAGPHFRVWDGRSTSGRSVPSGTYFYRLSVGDTQQAGRLVLAR